jgi:hypothetical protein
MSNGMLIYTIYFLSITEPWTNVLFRDVLIKWARCDSNT